MDSGFQFDGRSMNATADLVIGKQTEEALDLIDPGCRGGREVDVPTRPRGETVANELGLVGSGIINDEMDIEIVRDIGLDGVEKLAKLLRPMATEAPADDFTDLDIQRGEQGQRAMALIVMGSPLGLAGPHWQQRLCPVERLDLGFLVDAQHHGAIWRIE